MTLTRAPFFLPGKSLESPGRALPIVIFLVEGHQPSVEVCHSLFLEEPTISFYAFDTVESAAEASRTVQPTVLLLSLPLLGYAGLEALALIRTQGSLVEVPLLILADLVAEGAPSRLDAFRLGATDYLEKWPEPLEFIARVRSHAQAYGHLLERRKAYIALQVSQASLKAELAAAEVYLQGLIPKPLANQFFKADWFLEASEYLGGDTLGFHALDERHWAFYVIDVCGHGVGAALFSVLILNSLSHSLLPGVDYTKPDVVLSALNQAFPMEYHAGMYFTAWYGVYDVQSGLLTYASGGHPPALLLPPKLNTTIPVESLKTPGLVLGADKQSVYCAQSIAVTPGSRLYVFSDGVFEVECLPAHTFLGMPGWLMELQKPVPPGLSKPRFLFNAIRARHGRSTLEDDFTVLEVCFN